MALINIPDTGLWATIANALNSMFNEIFGRTGWASYGDTQYTPGNPFSVAADTDTPLPNNAGTTIDFQKPTDITTFYNGSVITGRSGDALDLMIYFKATPSAINQSLDVYIDITGGTGTPSDLARLYEQTFSFPRGAGVERGILYALPSSYTLDTWQLNGGVVYIRSDAALTLHSVNYNFDRTHKAR